MDLDWRLLHPLWYGCCIDPKHSRSNGDSTSCCTCPDGSHSAEAGSWSRRLAVTCSLPKRLLRMLLLSAALLSVFATGGDQARFNNLGHQMICMCGCNQILLECNHVGCTYSDRMRNQLMAGLTRGDSETQVQQWFVQEYGLTVLAAPVNRGFGRVAWVTPFAVFLGAL